MNRNQPSTNLAQLKPGSAAPPFGLCHSTREDSDGTGLFGEYHAVLNGRPAPNQLPNRMLRGIRMIAEWQAAQRWAGEYLQKLAKVRPAKPERVQGQAYPRGARCDDNTEHQSVCAAEWSGAGSREALNDARTKHGKRTFRVPGLGGEMSDFFSLLLVSRNETWGRAAA